MRSAQSGRSPWWMDQVSFASVSAGTPVASRSCAAAAADGANPTTWPPLSRHARARVRMAVVFPAPAGAIASCSRAPEVHMARTRAACPASKAFPFAADSSSANSTIAGVQDPAVGAARGRDETLLGGQNPGGGEQLGSGNRVDARTVDPTQHPRLADAVVGAESGPPIGSAAPRRQAAPPAAPPCRLQYRRRGRGVALRRGHASSARSSGVPPPPPAPVSAVAATHSASTAGLGVELGLRALLIMAWTASGPPSVSAAWACQVVRCSARLRGSCLASRVSKVACCASCNASTGVGGRP